MHQRNGRSPNRATSETTVVFTTPHHNNQVRVTVTNENPEPCCPCPRGKQPFAYEVQQSHPGPFSPDANSTAVNDQAFEGFNLDITPIDQIPPGATRIPQRKVGVPQVQTVRNPIGDTSPIAWHTLQYADHPRRNPFGASHLPVRNPLGNTLNQRAIPGNQPLVSFDQDVPGNIPVSPTNYRSPRRTPVRSPLGDALEHRTISWNRSFGNFGQGVSGNVPASLESCICPARVPVRNQGQRGMPSDYSYGNINESFHGNASVHPTFGDTLDQTVNSNQSWGSYGRYSPAVSPSRVGARRNHQSPGVNYGGGAVTSTLKRQPNQSANMTNMSQTPSIFANRINSFGTSMWSNTSAAATPHISSSSGPQTLDISIDQMRTGPRTNMTQSFQEPSRRAGAGAQQDIENIGDVNPLSLTYPNPQMQHSRLHDILVGLEELPVPAEQNMPTEPSAETIERIARICTPMLEQYRAMSEAVRSRHPLYYGSEDRDISEGEAIEIEKVQRYMHCFRNRLYSFFIDTFEFQSNKENDPGPRQQSSHGSKILTMLTAKHYKRFLLGIFQASSSNAGVESQAAFVEEVVTCRAEFHNAVEAIVRIGYPGLPLGSEIDNELLRDIDRGLSQYGIRVESVFGLPEEEAPSGGASEESSAFHDTHTSPVAAPRGNTSRATSPAATRAISPATSRATPPATSQATTPAALRTTPAAAAHATSPVTSRTTQPAGARATSPATSRATSPATTRATPRNATTAGTPRATPGAASRAEDSNASSSAESSMPSEQPSFFLSLNHADSPAAFRVTSPTAARATTPSTSRATPPAAPRATSPATSRVTPGAASRAGDRSVSARATTPVNSEPTSTSFHIPSTPVPRATSTPATPPAPIRATAARAHATSPVTSRTTPPAAARATSPATSRVTSPATSQATTAVALRGTPAGAAHGTPPVTSRTTPLATSRATSPATSQATPAGAAHATSPVISHTTPPAATRATLPATSRATSNATFHATSPAPFSMTPPAAFRSLPVATHRPHPDATPRTHPAATAHVTPGATSRAQDSTIDMSSRPVATKIVVQADVHRPNSPAPFQLTPPPAFRSFPVFSPPMNKSSAYSDQPTNHHALPTTPAAQPGATRPSTQGAIEDLDAILPADLSQEDPQMQHSQMYDVITGTQEPPVSQVKPLPELPSSKTIKQVARMCTPVLEKYKTMSEAFRSEHPAYYGLKVGPVSEEELNLIQLNQRIMHRFRNRLYFILMNAFEGGRWRVYCDPESLQQNSDDAMELAMLTAQHHIYIETLFSVANEHCAPNPMEEKVMDIIIEEIVYSRTVFHNRCEKIVRIGFAGLPLGTEVESAQLQAIERDLSKHGAAVGPVLGLTKLSVSPTSRVTSPDGPHPVSSRTAARQVPVVEVTPPLEELGLPSADCFNKIARCMTSLVDEHIDYGRSVHELLRELFAIGQQDKLKQHIGILHLNYKNFKDLVFDEFYDTYDEVVNNMREELPEASPSFPAEILTAIVCKQKLHLSKIDQDDEEMYEAHLLDYRAQFNEECERIIQQHVNPARRPFFEKQCELISDMLDRQELEQKDLVSKHLEERRKQGNNVELQQRQLYEAQALTNLQIREVNQFLGYDDSRLSNATNTGNEVTSGNAFGCFCNDFNSNDLVPKPDKTGDCYCLCKGMLPSPKELAQLEQTEVEEMFRTLKRWQINRRQVVGACIARKAGRVQ